MAEFFVDLMFWSVPIGAVIISFWVPRYFNLEGDKAVLFEFWIRISRITSVLLLPFFLWLYLSGDGLK
jgi:hypothetical protein